MLKFLSLVLLFIFSINSEASVWQTKERWDAQWERKFNEWVAGPEWHKDFFVQAGPLQGLKLDCADAVYSMRLLFSAKHGLPFVIKDPTGGSSRISNEMSRWDSQNSSQRLRSFLSYIYGITSTHSLPNDTYPVAIGYDTMGSGSLIYTDALSRHTWTVKFMSETGIPFLLSRGTPKATRMFENYEYPPADYVFAGGMRPERHAGFRRFRQPAFIGKPVWDVPGYSTEQYRVPVQNWNNVMQERTAQRAETKDERIARLLEGICKTTQERAVVVGIGDSFLSNMSRKCMTDDEYYQFSTPSRDKRFKMALEQFAAEAEMASGQISSEIQRKVDNVLAGEASVNSSSPYCQIDLGSGLSLTLGQIYERSLSGKLSHSPHDTLAMRWGSAKFPSNRAKQCGR